MIQETRFRSFWIVGVAFVGALIASVFALALLFRGFTNDPALTSSISAPRSSPQVDAPGKREAIEAGEAFLKLAKVKLAVSNEMSAREKTVDTGWGKRPTWIIGGRGHDGHGFGMYFDVQSRKIVGFWDLQRSEWELRGGEPRGRPAFSGKDAKKFALDFAYRLGIPKHLKFRFETSGMGGRYGSLIAGGAFSDVKGNVVAKISVDQFDGGLHYFSLKPDPIR
jgi:hypothetical protein